MTYACMIYVSQQFNSVQIVVVYLFKHTKSLFDIICELCPHFVEEFIPLLRFPPINVIIIILNYTGIYIIIIMASSTEFC